MSLNHQRNLLSFETTVDVATVVPNAVPLLKGDSDGEELRVDAKCRKIPPGGSLGPDRVQASFPDTPNGKCSLLLTTALTKQSAPALSKVVEHCTGRILFCCRPVESMGL